MDPGGHARGSRLPPTRWCDQFSGYHPLPDLAINGKLTQTENIADLAGLAAAFDAYRETLGSQGHRPGIRPAAGPGVLHRVRAKLARQDSARSALRTQIATDGHAPESYRIATVRNIDAWYDAFDVRPGQRLYLEPKARVRIW